MVYDWVKAIFYKTMSNVPMYYNGLELGHGEMVDTVSSLNIKSECFLSWASFGDQFQDITFVVNTRILGWIDDWTKYVVSEPLLRSYWNSLDLFWLWFCRTIVLSIVIEFTRAWVSWVDHFSLTLSTMINEGGFRVQTNTNIVSICDVS